MDITTGKCRILVMDADRVIFEGEVASIFVPGDHGEFELLPYHFPVLSVLKEGVIIIDWEKKIKMKKGIIRFFKNECVIIME